MFRIRVSIASLMLIVVVFALEFAALRSGSPLWFSAVYTFTALGLLFAVVASKYGWREARPFWFGFAVFGGGYFLLALGPWGRPNPDLASTRLIATFLHEVRGNAPEPEFRGSSRSRPNVGLHGLGSVSVGNQAA